MTSLNTLYDKFCESSGITTDTRKIQKGNIFFALKGGNFNGNKFAKQALESGCSYAVIDEKQQIQDDRYLLVTDVLESLQQLASHHRKVLNLPVIALTGSNGKTTTKELIASVLQKKFKLLATKGNFNNHIGVPLTLLSINASHEIAVIEMGANHQKEIDALCEIAQPDMGLITNIGRAHLDGFGGIEGVIKGKTELYRYLQKHKGIIFYNADNPLLEKLTPKETQNISYGKAANADCQYKAITDTKYATLVFHDKKISSHLQGQHQYENIAAAICIGKHFDIPTDLIAQAISEYIPENNRSQELKTSYNNILLDAYNANPSSMKVSLEHFLSDTSKEKLLILGDMFELGAYSKQEHQTIIDLLQSKNVSDVILVGTSFYELKTNNGFRYFKETQDCADYLQKQSIRNKSILIKGSRSMKLETLSEFL